MRNLQSLQIIADSKEFKIPKSGNLENNYKPLKNLQLDSGEIVNFTTNLLNYNINNPVVLETQPSYDGSVNLIINDDLNPPMLINTRFSVEENNTFSIPDHFGVNDTNLYSEKTLNLDTRLYKTTTKIPKLTYRGISLNGNLKCGTYHFYFKYSDADNNETDFITESGVVTCHIGNIKDPFSMRMGLVNENSKKSVNFKLENLDTQFDYLKIYYTRTTSDNSSIDVTTAHYIDFKYPIKSETLNLSITGLENEIDISLSEINLIYELAGTVKTQTQCQNMLFLGNINKPEIQYSELADLSLRITPEIVNTENIGNIDHEYIDRTGRNLYEYYNTENIYNYLGVWPEEYYRLGIVYILNDFSLSPVFNIRGIDLSKQTTFAPYKVYDTSNERVYIEYNQDGYIPGTTVFENSKGVIKVPKLDVIKSDGIYPLGIKFKFQQSTGSTHDVDVLTELKKYTKGFFLVRQERIPTILAQGCTIGKTKNDYGGLPVIPVSSTSAVVESFLNSDKTLVPTLLDVDSSKYEIKGIISPEVELRTPTFSQILTSTNYVLTNANEQSINKIEKLQYSSANHYKLTRDINDATDTNNTLTDFLKSANLTLVNDNIKLSSNGVDYFSTRAGEAEEAWNVVDVENIWNKVKGDTINSSSKLVRGIFGTFIGAGNVTLDYGKIVNIRPDGYNESDSYKTNQFKVRLEDNSVYGAISDRYSTTDTSYWSTPNSIIAYRGDCYIGNFTHRVMRNFIDPELPTNDKIVDVSTWSNNFKVKQEFPDNNAVAPDGNYINRVLITYKQKGSTIIEPSDAKFGNVGSGLSNLLGGGEDGYLIKGCSKINRGDVNSVNLGHWFTFKTMANINVSLRDIDLSDSYEQSLFGHPRSFYPLQKMSTASSFKTKDSNTINGGANVTLSKRYNFLIPDVPFIKNKFDTRILYSDIHITDAFTNGYRVFRGGHYRDYSKTYGAIVDMKEWYGNLFLTMEHGCLLIPVNERAVSGEGAGGNIYINTSNVLPENPRVVSDLFGSTWQESVIKTKTGIYGIDTVAKKIWCASPTDTGSLQLINISDLKVQRFLNENINLKESDKVPTLGLRNVKTHYNKNKGDILFTFYNASKQWNLCYNENLKKFSTFYSWIPSHSANINNVFFSLDKEDSTTIYNNRLVTPNSTYVKLWKHGQSGIYDNQGKILPTNWYGTQRPFEFEFVVAEVPGVQKIFNNLKLISNKAEPDSFEFEVVGESYEWFNFKDIIVWISDKVLAANGTGVIFNTLENGYKYVLSHNQNSIVTTYPDFPKLFNKEDSYIIPKLPLIPRLRRINPTDVGYIKGKDNYELNTANITLITDNLLNEDRVHTQQIGNDLRKFGRMRGNMQYLEDRWDVEIKPINFKYAYLNSDGSIKYTTGKETRIRDKYMKVRVKYSGKDLAIVQGIKTNFTLSYA